MFDAKQVKKMKREMIAVFNDALDSCKNEFKGLLDFVFSGKEEVKPANKVTKKAVTKAIKTVKAKRLGRPKKVA